MTEGLKLITLTYRWRKFVKPKEISFSFLFIHLYKIVLSIVLKIVHSINLIQDIIFSADFFTGSDNPSSNLILFG